MRGTRAVWTVVVGCLALSCASAQSPGLAFIRYHSSDFQRPMDTGVLPALDLDTGTAINDYSAIHLGWLRLPAEQVTLVAEADDGVKLWVGEQYVLGGWPATEAVQGDVSGHEGDWLPLRAEYYQSGGEGHLRLKWSWPGHPLEPVPPAAFRTSSADVQAVHALFDGTTAAIYNEAPPTRPAAVPARPGPHLFIDDALIETSDGLVRRVRTPQRDPQIANPIITGPEDHAFQPYFTVLRDPQTGRFRCWYGASGEDQNPARSRIGYLESDDGIHWQRPARFLPEAGPIQFGCEVVDRGPDCPAPDQRFVHAYYWDGGLCLGTSPDGLGFKPLHDGPVFRHSHDINNLWWDPLRKRYVATVSYYEPDPGGKWSGQRRVTRHSVSGDLLNWTAPWFVLTPHDGVDEGETQFYAMGAYLTRGPLTIGMVKVLRDDLKADVPPHITPEAYGIGYTALAWTRDGVTWTRDRTPFFERDRDRDAWDHSHAWIDEQVPVGDQVYLYYGGYKQGHKVNRFSERQIGLVTMPRDRYVARETTGDAPGLLRTVAFRLDDVPLQLKVNATADGGRLRVQVRRADTDQVVPGLSLDDCQVDAVDGVDEVVRWNGAADLGALRGQAVRFEFELRHAAIYGFALVPQGSSAAASN